MSRLTGVGRSGPADPAEETLPLPITVRVPGALRLTGLSRTKLYALIAAGEIDIVKVGAATLIVVDSIHAFVDRQRHRATGR